MTTKAEDVRSILARVYQMGASYGHEATVESNYTAYTHNEWPEYLPAINQIISENSDIADFLDQQAKGEAVSWQRRIVLDSGKEGIWRQSDAEGHSHDVAHSIGNCYRIESRELYTRPSPAQSEPVSVPDGWKPTNEEVHAWRNKNDFDMFSLDDCRSAIEDARSIHLLATAAKPAAQPST